MIPESQEKKNMSSVRPQSAMPEGERMQSRSENVSSQSARHEEERLPNIRPNNVRPEQKKALPKETKLQKYGRIGRWFQIICCMNIPVIGFLYMVILACSRKTEVEKKAFAKAYVLFRILVFFLALVILYVLYRVGLDFVDGMLQYAK